MRQGALTWAARPVARQTLERLLRNHIVEAVACTVEILKVASCRAQGYEGPLCIACSEGYRSRSRQCIPCDAASDTPGTAVGIAITAAVVAVVAGGIYFWRSYMSR